MSETLSSGISLMATSLLRSPCVGVAAGDADVFAADAPPKSDMVAAFDGLVSQRVVDPLSNQD